MTTYRLHKKHDLDTHTFTHTFTHTHTHTFNGPFSGTTRAGQYQKGKTNLDFAGARDSEWQWHQLGHMQVCTSLQTDNHAPHIVFFTGRMPFLPPNQQRQSTEAWPRYCHDKAAFQISKYRCLVLQLLTTCTTNIRHIGSTWTITVVGNNKHAAYSKTTRRPSLKVTRLMLHKLCSRNFSSVKILPWPKQDQGEESSSKVTLFNSYHLTRTQWTQPTALPGPQNGP